MTPTKKKPAAKKTVKRERKSANDMVYFGCKAGTFVIQSKDRQIAGQANGRPIYEPVEEIKLEFGNKGVSRPLHPKHDAVIIKEFRDYIQAAKDNEYWGDYDRVKINNLREMHPNSPAMPAPNWDNLAADKVKGIVESLELNVDKCILYEEYNKNRPEVLDVLDAIASGDAAPAKPEKSEKPSL